MHRLSRIKIENFKSIIDGEFPLSSYTPLVGYNNAGKTNILQAASWLVKKTSLPDTDFNDSQNPVVVTAYISGITEQVLDSIGGAHRPRIEPLVANSEICIRRVQTQPFDRTTNIRLEVLKPNQGGEPQWEANPAGIDAAISHLFPDPIFIGAMENATEDVGKFASGTTVGKLIKEIMGPISAAHTEPVTNALADIAKKLSAEGEEKDATLIDLDNKIQTELAKFFPGVSAKTHIATPEFEDFLKSATIRFFDNTFHNPQGRDASSFGHGAQRSVQIALIKCLSDLRRAGAAAGRTTLLLIDEPELYLHPQAIELVRASLSRLANEGYQVLFSTHSPAMISRVDASKALLVRRSLEVGTHAFPRIEDAVDAAIENADHQAETLFSLTNSSKILFSERIVLAEGKTERALLPEIFAHEFQCSLDEDRLGLVELGGVDNVPNAMRVLGAMGIPARAIVDLDFVFRGAVAANILAEDHEGLLGCKSVLQRLADDGRIAIDAAGLPTRHGEVSASMAFALMAQETDALPHLQSLHNSLINEPIWFWVRGTVEEHLGLPAKTTAAQLAFLSNFKDAAFQESLPDYDSIKAALGWLREA